MEQCPSIREVLDEDLKIEESKKEAVYKRRQYLRTQAACLSADEEDLDGGVKLVEPTDDRLPGHGHQAQSVRE